MAMAAAKRSGSAAGRTTPDGGEGAEPGPTLGYEDARAALAEVVAALESGDVSLEEALALWEQGEEYARICQAWLAGAQERLSREEVSQEESAPPLD
jgi:exodeoxyribonuclease VII small subunit